MDIRDCLNKFQDLMACHGLFFDLKWRRLILPCSSPSQRTWFMEYQENKTVLSWERFKQAFITQYGIDSAEEKDAATAEFLNISMSAGENIDQCIERFNNLRRLAHIQDACVSTRCFFYGFNDDIHSRVVVALANCPESKKESVDHAIKSAKSIYNSPYRNFRAGNVAITNESSSSTGKKRSVVASSSVLRASPYPKVQKKSCSHHQSSSHNDSEYRVLKKESATTITSATSSVTPLVALGPNTEGSSASYWNPSNPKPSGIHKKCFKCDADNWRLGYRCYPNSSSNSVTPPTHAFRAMSMSPSVSSAASSSDVFTSSGSSADAMSSAAAPTSASVEDEKMDLADALVAEAAQACKYITHPLLSNIPSDTNTLCSYYYRKR
ncbi:hypothetical protein G6F56_003610 [Rhizopus delemar]|nr:hypothetical protein G6F56_003610 [Rhizopus delemar]